MGRIVCCFEAVMVNGYESADFQYFPYSVLEDVDRCPRKPGVLTVEYHDHERHHEFGETFHVP